MITFDYSNALGFIGGQEAVDRMEPQVKAAADMLHKKNGPGNDFLGWLDLPSAYDKEEFARIRKSAQKIRRDSDVLIVIGIGGSYLGARAVIEMLNHSFQNAVSKKVRKSPLILFCGNSISATYLADLMDVIEGKDVSLNIISKSGTTTEPAIAFRILRAYMEKKYGKEEARSRIYATTDKARGALKGLATEEGYESFVVPDDVGGRFSVLTAVGLLPIAVAGIDIRELMKGARDASKAYKKLPLSENPCYQYAAVRNCLLRSGYSTEVMVNYEPSFHYMTEWWKQLYGESEGKQHKGIFPASVDFTTDLHSMGQWIQDGERSIFETVISIREANREVRVPHDEENLDGLNFLAGKRVDEVNKMAELGTRLAHIDGGVPNILIEFDKIDEYNIGQFIYFFERGCGISGYMLGVNPFDQPGVEAYKKNMFALLNKPGYEKESAAIQARIGK